MIAWAGRGWGCGAFVVLLSAARAATPWEFGAEFAGAGDVDLWQGSVVTTLAGTAGENAFSVAHNRLQIDYEPVAFDFQGESRTRRESATALQWNARRQVNEAWTTLFGAGAYDGFTNYRSVWLDEYFRQQYSDLTSVPGADLYTTADPHGFNVSAGARWMYRPASGFAQLTVSQLQDDVSPGYEIDFDGLRRGELTLTTTAINLALENVLTPRARSLIEVRAAKTSGREWRWGFEAGCNLALGERWVARLQAGASTEDPQFDAWYGGATIEYEVSPAFAVFVSARYYEDTGEIENALLFSSAAPGLRSRQFGGGIRWKGDAWSARLYAAPLHSRYDPTNPDTDFFQNLYADRDWTIVQFAVARSFGS